MQASTRKLVFSSLARVLKALLGSAVSAVALKILITWVKFLRVNSFIRSLPYQPASPVGELTGYLWHTFKNFPRFMEHRVDVYKAAEKKAGKPVHTLIFPPPIHDAHLVIGTKDPVLVKHILKDKFDTWNKPTQHVEHFGELLGKGIFGIKHGPHTPDNGETWKAQRKTASLVFTRNVFNGHVYNTLVKNADIVLKKIDLHMNASPTKPLDLVPLLYGFAIDTIGETGFGVNLNALGRDDLPPFSAALDGALSSSATRQLHPFWKYLKWFYTAEKDMKQHMKVLDEFAYRLVKEKKQTSLDGKGDILSLFMQANPDAGDVFYRDILVCFFIAGRDTTTGTLSFMFYLLGINLAEQEKLYEEVASIFEKYDNPEKATLEMFQHMPYLDGVMFEMLRMYPPVPLDLKEASVDDTLPDGTFVPKGTEIIFDIFVMNHDEKVYEDPWTFRPERWFRKKDGSPRDIQNFNPYEFPVFQAGKRICLGKDLAFFESKLFLVEFIRKFKWKYIPTPDEKPNIHGETIIYEPSAGAIRKKGPVLVELTKRT